MLSVGQEGVVKRSAVISVVQAHEGHTDGAIEKGALVLMLERLKATSWRCQSGVGRCHQGRKKSTKKLRWLCCDVAAGQPRTRPERRRWGGL